MCDEWMPVLRFPLTLEQYHQLPRNPAYKYEFIQGQALLTPRAKHYHAYLDLDSFAGEEVPENRLQIRAIESADWPELEKVFTQAFADLQPFGSLDSDRREEATRSCLEKTRSGGDGPWMEQASFLAAMEQKPVGAILITLLPGGDPFDEDSFYWKDLPPADFVERRQGQPHVTWIFVSRWEAGTGIGTALLAAAVQALRAMGYRQLWSTFLAGNDSSMLWHWRNGFQLLPYPLSRRRLLKKNERRNLSGMRPP